MRTTGRKPTTRFQDRNRRVQFNLSIGQDMDRNIGWKFGMNSDEVRRGRQGIPLQDQYHSVRWYDDNHLLEPVAVADYQTDLFDSGVKV